MNTTTITEQKATQVRTVSGVEGLAGIWLLFAPFILNYSGTNSSTLNDIIVGIIIIFAAGYEMAGEHFRDSTASWVNAILGVWLLLVPFILSFPSGSTAMWNDVITGIILAFLGVSGALLTPQWDKNE